MKISRSVGKRGINLSNDVRIIQTLLNKARKSSLELGSAFSELTVDGACGPKTIDAISQFQSIRLCVTAPDGRVDPGFRTWRALNNNVASVAQVQQSSLSHKPVVDTWVAWLKRNMPSSFLSLLEESENCEPPLAQVTPKNVASKSKIPALRQGDPKWGRTLLGSGTSTIHGAGCTMVSLTMAATYLGSPTKHWPKDLKPSQLTPLHTNNILKQAGVFAKNSSSMFVSGAATALGMENKEYGRDLKSVNASKQSTFMTLIDEALVKGLVLAHVNYKGGWSGDHWILITGKHTGGHYTGIDPTYGKALKLYRTPDTGVTPQKHIMLYGRSTSMSPKTPENVKKYELVRFLTLQ